MSKEIEYILDSLVGEQKRVEVISKKSKIDEADIPTKPQLIPDCLVDNEEIKSRTLKKYFMPKAFEILRNKLEQKKGDDKYTCPICQENLDRTAIQCDSWLYWFDYPCVGLDGDDKTTEDEEVLFCNDCIQNAK